ncbi:MAG: hypothetical protein AB2809_21315 [Candidatus Thiodiazotropha sp.]
MAKKRKYFAGGKPEKGRTVTTTQAPTEIDAKFIALVRARQYPEAIALIPEVTDINVRDPGTQASALHFAAARRCIILLRELEKRDELDYLAQDRQGRLPSQLAWEECGHEKLGAELIRKEKAYADRIGISAWSKSPPSGMQPK